MKKIILLLVAVVMVSLTFTSCVNENRTITVKNLSKQFFYEECDLNLYDVVLYGYIGDDMVEELQINGTIYWGSSISTLGFKNDIEKVRVGAFFSFYNPLVTPERVYTKKLYYLKNNGDTEIVIDENSIFTRFLD